MLLKAKQTRSYLASKKVILFDMDGTLFNTEPLHAKALQVVLSENGYEIPINELESKAIGRADDDIFKELLGVQCDTINLVKRKNEILKLKILALSREELLNLQTPGMIDLLIHLKSKNILLGLISASEKEIIELIVNRSGIGVYLSTIVGRSDTKHSKPFPDPYIFAMKQLLSNPDQTLIFEDSPTGIESARLSGAEVIIINPKASDTIEDCSIANFSWLK